MININTAERWSENVIIVDGDYIDRVAFDLTVNFERMCGTRRRSAPCGRSTNRKGRNRRFHRQPSPDTQTTQVFFLHDKRTGKVENFTPDD